MEFVDLVLLGLAGFSFVMIIFCLWPKFEDLRKGWRFAPSPVAATMSVFILWFVYSQCLFKNRIIISATMPSSSNIAHATKDKCKHESDEASPIMRWYLGQAQCLANWSVRTSPSDEPLKYLLAVHCRRENQHSQLTRLGLDTTRNSDVCVLHRKRDRHNRMKQWHNVA